jgi:serine/threonine-protein kinase
LNAAHDQGVVHRDLKPGNVFLVQIPGEPDFVKVLDFGISKMKAARTQLTSASAVMGTPNYMSPEQATGMIDDIDHRADQWALACIAWEMLLGRCPFVADETAALLYQIINLDPHPLATRVPGLPPAVETALRRALRKKPAERFSSMREFSRELEAAAFGRPADVTPAPVTVSSITSPTHPTIGYSATQVPLTPVRMQPAGSSPRDARKVEAGVSQTSVSSFHAIVAGVRGWVQTAMAWLRRIRPLYAIVAGAGVLLLLGAFLLLRSSPAPKPAVTSAVQPVATPLPQPPAPPAVAPESTAATTAQPAHRSARPKHPKWADPFADGQSNKPNPFTDGESNKPKQTITPRRKAKKKLYEEL